MILGQVLHFAITVDAAMAIVFFHFVPFFGREVIDRRILFESTSPCAVFSGFSGVLLQIGAHIGGMFLLMRLIISAASCLFFRKIALSVSLANSAASFWVSPIKSPTSLKRFLVMCFSIRQAYVLVVTTIGEFFGSICFDIRLSVKSFLCADFFFMAPVVFGVAGAFALQAFFWRQLGAWHSSYSSCRASSVMLWQSVRCGRFGLQSLATTGEV